MFTKLFCKLLRKKFPDFINLRFLLFPGAYKLQVTQKCFYFDEVFVFFWRTFAQSKSSFSMNIFHWFWIHTQTHVNMRFLGVPWFRSYKRRKRRFVVLSWIRGHEASHIGGFRIWTVSEILWFGLNLLQRFGEQELMGFFIFLFFDRSHFSPKVETYLKVSMHELTSK